MITDLNDYFEVNPNFDIFDPFGMKRLKQAASDFDNYRFEKNRQIESYRKTLDRQAKMLRSMVAENERLQNEKVTLEDQLENYIQKITELNKRTAIAEAAKLNSAKNLEEAIEENESMKIRLREALADYDELSEVHEKLCEIIQKERPDILIDSIESKRSVD